MTHPLVWIMRLSIIDLHAATTCQPRAGPVHQRLQ